MFIRDHALTVPDKPAIICSSGETVSYAALDRRSNRLAHLLRSLGLRRGDHVAIFMENNARFFDVVWAAFRSGLYITPISRHLPAPDVAYIVENCQAKAVFSSFLLRDAARSLPELAPNCRTWLMLGGTIDGWNSYEEAVKGQPATPLAQEWMGEAMLYSSGTTGRPKGIWRPLPDIMAGEGFALGRQINPFDLSFDTVYLSPAPAYHAAPLRSITNIHSFGGTVVMMERFDPALALSLIERHRVTHSQWVPAMFVRMLQMPVEDRSGYDLGSHRVAIHAAAPCPIEVKQRMIEWWGPILLEYYGASEGIGRTVIPCAEWLRHPGSVGRAVNIHICTEDGGEADAGAIGLIYFEYDGVMFEYHGDPSKTASARHPSHENWITLGDIGYVDDDGYLYLTDRSNFMIISGGVNIYPQAIEDALILHPKVSDIAVFGIPDAEMGEAVKAVVEPRPGIEPNPELATEILAFASERLARYMVPRSIDFIAEMPRLPTGKLLKRTLRDPYWPAVRPRG